MIDQVLLLLYQWKLPAGDALYTYVQEQATAAKDQRDAQRQRMLDSAATGA